MRLLDGRHIQSIIGPLPADNGDPQRQSQGIQGRQLDLHLRQVGSVIFAVPKLKQAVWAGLDVATDRGTIDAHPAGVQIIHADQVLTQRPLTGLPPLIVTQVIQHCGQTIIREIQAAHLLPQAGLQAGQVPARPGFDVIEPMVPFRKDVAQPDHTDHSQAQPLPIPMRGKVPIQKGGDLHAFQLRQQDRYVVNSFRREMFYFVHGASVTSILPTV